MSSGAPYKVPKLRLEIDPQHFHLLNEMQLGDAWRVAAMRLPSTTTTNTTTTTAAAATTTAATAAGAVVCELAAVPACTVALLEIEADIAAAPPDA